MEKLGKLSLNYPCYPFLSGALFIISWSNKKRHSSKPHPECHSKVTWQCITDQWNDTLASVIVPQEKLHVFNDVSLSACKRRQSTNLSKWIIFRIGQTNRGITILYHPHQCRPCSVWSISCSSLWHLARVVYVPHKSVLLLFYIIGVGRFRILGGPRFRILGGPRGGQIPSRHMTS